MNTIAYSSDTTINTGFRPNRGPSTGRTGPAGRRSPVLSRRELRRVIAELLG